MDKSGDDIAQKVRARKKARFASSKNILSRQVM
jgi:hypothetical protein